jgi:hypothetical protein
VSVEEMGKAELVPPLTPLRVREHHGRAITNAKLGPSPSLGNRSGPALQSSCREKITALPPL